MVGILTARMKLMRKLRRSIHCLHIHFDECFTMLIRFSCPFCAYNLIFAVNHSPLLCSFSTPQHQFSVCKKFGKVHQYFIFQLTESLDGTTDDVSNAKPCTKPLHQLFNLIVEHPCRHPEPHYTPL